MDNKLTEIVFEIDGDTELGKSVRSTVKLGKPCKLTFDGMRLDGGSYVLIGLCKDIRKLPRSSTIRVRLIPNPPD